MLFGDSVLGQEQNINILLEYQSRTQDRAMQSRLTSWLSLYTVQCTGLLCLGIQLDNTGVDHDMIDALFILNSYNHIQTCLSK